MLTKAERKSSISFKMKWEHLTEEAKKEYREFYGVPDEVENPFLIDRRQLYIYKHHKLGLCEKCGRTKIYKNRVCKKHYNYIMEHARRNSPTYYSPKQINRRIAKGE